MTVESSTHIDSPPATPDRGHLLTEQRNPRSMALDTLSVRQCVDLINTQDETVATAVALRRAQIASFIEAIENRMRHAAQNSAMGRLIYIGAGTSGRLGVLDAAECPPTFCTPPGMVVGLIAGGDSALRTSSEGIEDDRAGAHAELARLGLGVHDSILGIAAGGTTPYVLGALEEAARCGCLTGLLTCSPVETPPFVDHHIIIETGPEVVTGSTRMKAGTATKLVLNTISTTLMVRMGKVYENLMVDLRAGNSKLRDRAARIIATLCNLSRPQALELLDQAGGSCKAAIIMHRQGITRDQAETRLAQCGGMLRAALDAGSQVIHRP